MSQRRPLQVPRWADVGGGITEPSSGRKDVGWITGLRPAAQFMNWLQNLFFQWINHTKDAALLTPFHWSSQVQGAPGGVISALASGAYGSASTQNAGLRIWVGVGTALGAKPSVFDGLMHWHYTIPMSAAFVNDLGATII